MNPALLLLADSRLPAGGHAHSGGTERAIASGAVFDVPSLARFLRGRLHTTGALAATLTAAAHTHATTPTTTPPTPPTSPPDVPPPTTRPHATTPPPGATSQPTPPASAAPRAVGASPAVGGSLPVVAAALTARVQTAALPGPPVPGASSADPATAGTRPTTPPQPPSSASTAITEPAPGIVPPGTGSGGGLVASPWGTGKPGAEPPSGPRAVAEPPSGPRAVAEVGQAVPESPWVLLDAEVDARTASPAQRDASRTQGRLLLRVARRVWPSPVLEELARAVPSPHHPIALGAVAHAAGATAEEAAMAAAYHAISGPATAAVRLLGLDPVAVHGLLADLTPDLTAIATQAHLAVTNARATAMADTDSTGHPNVADADSTTRPDVADADSTGHSGVTSQTPDPADPRPWLGALPAYSSPALDLLAEQHARAEVRLFVS
ncbi:urease accessory UreF family protein [Nonomuraea sp. NPDC050451]|uniref:urease accessory UreF family protein n=1 Tax=Nonomuraea sp. NPDC050451 TaxID=3364364 RepID=UPI0037AF53F2